MPAAASGLARVEPRHSGMGGIIQRGFVSVEKGEMGARSKSGISVTTAIWMTLSNWEPATLRSH